MTSNQTAVASQPNEQAQIDVPLDFLSRFTPNERMLVSQLFRAAVSKKHVTKPSSVLFDVYRELTRRCFRALGESEGIGYGHSLEILRDHKQESEQYAVNVLRATGKLSVASQKKGGSR